LIGLNLKRSQSQSQILAKHERGAVMVETTFGIFVFAILFLFMLYFYEALETKVAVQINSGIDLRKKMIQSNTACYRRVQSFNVERVELPYKINNFVPSQARSVEIEANKIGHTGACIGLGRSRFDNDRSRQPRSPNGSRQGSW